MAQKQKIRLLIVDDSAIVRKILTDTLGGEPDIEIVGTAPDPYIARDKIIALKPDVLTLDIEMPRMDGLTFLRKLMQSHPLPVVIISSLAQPSARIAMEALEAGAVEVLAKPSGPYSVGDLRQGLAQKVRAAAAARIRRPDAEPVHQEDRRTAILGPIPVETRPAEAHAPEPNHVEVARHDPPHRALLPNTVIAIGASTGGTEAIAAVMKVLPASTPGILITQHIPPYFSRAFANRLNGLGAMDVKEAEDGDYLRPGLALVAPGDFHMIARKSGGRFYVNVKDGPRVCYQRPSVDVLFHSVAETAGGNAVGVLLTGMGNDGAQGLLRMRQAGARTIAQDEASCVVYGMPREAARLGAAEQIVGLRAMAEAILSARPTLHSRT